MKKIFYMNDVRDIFNQLKGEEISMSKALEMMNEKAENHNPWTRTMDELPPADKKGSEFSIDCLVTGGGKIWEDFFDFSTQKFHKADSWVDYWMPRPKMPN